MTKNSLIEYINQGREIEFQYNGKKYSITYGKYKGKEVISFCEFYKYSTEVMTTEELLNVTRDDVTVLEMWENISEENIWLF